MQEEQNIYVGLMSGTSQDGVDIALTEIKSNTLKTIDAFTLCYPDEIRMLLKRLCQTNERIYLKDIAEVEYSLGDFFSKAVLQLLDKHPNLRKRIRAIGTHGHTLYHLPKKPFPYSIQVGGAAILNARTGIKTVYDFRGADIANGGEGAPLVPAFHDWAFANTETEKIIVNIGGIANITILRNSGEILGFDTGPGNCLLDEWYEKNQGGKFDENGDYGASGFVNTKILSTMLADEFFVRAPPKSTAREFFNIDYLYHKVGLQQIASCRPEDIQATLMALTATSITNSINKFTKNGQSEVYLCGGGVKNRGLTALLKKLLAPRSVKTTLVLGYEPDYIEAVAFSWLAYMRISELPVRVTTNPNFKQLILGSVCG